MGKTDRKAQRADGGSNLMGKFTHSVKRLVKDVADETLPGGQSKESAIQINIRLRVVTYKIGESYETAKKSLTTLHERYNESKTTRNVFHRYRLLKAMIKEVIRLDIQYWTLVDIPKQEKQESVPVYVLRACAALERSARNKGGDPAKVAEEEAKARERTTRLENLSFAEVETENTQLINDLYRLLKKYTGIRTLMRELKHGYMGSKIYPIVPRYTMLKEMIRDIVRDPNYMEVCHEENVTCPS